MATVLIIEDVKEMADLITLYLSKEGMEVLYAETGEEALKIVENVSLDAIVLDLNLPGIDGFEFLNIFRQKYSVPVIIVSARDADEDIINGLGFGADDFVTKPFSPRVLVARVLALIRRSQDKSDLIYEFGNFILDSNSFTLKKKTENNKLERVPLSTKEYAVLLFLIENAGVSLSPETIYAEVWKAEYGDLSAVAVYVQRLRKKIEENPSKPVFLKTIFGKGYCFNFSKKTEE